MKSHRPPYEATHKPFRRAHPFRSINLAQNRPSAPPSIRTARDSKEEIGVAASSAVDLGKMDPVNLRPMSDKGHPGRA